MILPRTLCLDEVWTDQTLRFELHMKTPGKTKNGNFEVTLNFLDI
jgi:hypothetical protein